MACGGATSTSCTTSGFPASHAIAAVPEIFRILGQFYITMKKNYTSNCLQYSLLENFFVIEMQHFVQCA
jgi:hypothetical protein